MKANTDKRINMYQLEKNLIDELNDNKEEILKNEDLLHEYVDSHVPVYNYDRLLLACDDLWLGYIWNKIKREVSD